MSKSLTDAELAEIRKREWASSWLRDIPRLLATIDELAGIISDQRQESAIYDAGIAEEKKRQDHFPVLAFRALDVLLRRGKDGWCVFLDPTDRKWRLVTSMFLESHQYVSDGWPSWADWIATHGFDDPFTALVESDKQFRKMKGEPG